jgi:hypothetical protein
MKPMLHAQVSADIATQINESALTAAAAGANVLTSISGFAGPVPAAARVDERAPIILAW